MKNLREWRGSLFSKGSLSTPSKTFHLWLALQGINFVAACATLTGMAFPAEVV